jgi:hypothetical protein
MSQVKSHTLSVHPIHTTFFSFPAFLIRKDPRAEDLNIDLPEEEREVEFLVNASSITLIRPDGDGAVIYTPDLQFYTSVSYDEILCKLFSTCKTTPPSPSSPALKI